MSQLAENTPVARWKRLGDMLLEGGLITPGQLDEGLAEKDRQKCFLGQALVRLGYLTQDELIAFLVKHLQGEVELCGVTRKAMWKPQVKKPRCSSR